MSEKRITKKDLEDALDEVIAERSRLRADNAMLVEALEEVIDAVNRDIIRVRPSDRKEFLESLTIWNRILAKVKK